MSKVKAVIGGANPILLEGLRQVLLDTCEVSEIISNPEAWVRAASGGGIELAIIAAGEMNWDARTLMHRLPLESRGIAFIVMVPGHSLHEQSSRLLPTARRLELLPDSVSGETLVKTVRRVIEELHSSASAPAAALLAPLTERQQKILLLLCLAESTRSIAEILHISVRTVEFHKYRMMKVLGVNTTTELVLFGVQAGLGTSSGKTASANSSPSQ